MTVIIPTTTNRRFAARARKAQLLSKRAPFCAVVALLVALATGAYAQDPFGDPPAGGAPMPGAGDPFGAGGGTTKPAGEKKADESPIDEPPVIQQLRDSKPDTATKLLEAAHAVLLYGRPDESKRYLSQLLGAKLPEAQFAEAAKEVGSAVLLRLASDPAIQPEGKQAADMAFAAGAKVAADPALIATMIPLLASDSPVDQRRALSQLADAGPNVVAPLLKWLADPAKKNDAKYIRAALTRLATDTEEPLLAALQHPNDSVREQVILTLGMMKSQRAVPQLVGIVGRDENQTDTQAAAACLRRIIGSSPSRAEAAKYLRQEIAELFAGMFPIAADPDGNVPHWTLDAKSGNLNVAPLPRRDAALQLATILADDLAAIDSESLSAKKLQLITALEQAKIASGYQQGLDLNLPAVKQALDADVLLVEQSLTEAMAMKRPLAAVALCEVLGQKNETVLQGSGGSKRALAEALTSTDRRVRLAATLAILKIQPQQRFAGSSYFILALQELLATTGDRRVLIAHPRAVEGQSLVGFMKELSFDAESATTGKRILESAVQNPDYEMLLISTSIDQPPVVELVQWLRRDYRTAGLPIGVMARNEELDELRERFADDKLVHVMPHILEVGHASFEIDRMITRMGRAYVTRDERMQLARTATKALAPMLASSTLIDRFELRRLEQPLLEAITRSTLSPQATDLLGILATPKAQLSLVEFASEPSHAAEARDRAAKAFAAARKSRGLLLTQARILEQYAIYNASETQSKETQAILGSILDAIEDTPVTPTSTTSSK